MTYLALRICDGQIHLFFSLNDQTINRQSVAVSHEDCKWSNTEKKKKKKYTELHVSILNRPIFEWNELWDYIFIWIYRECESESEKSVCIYITVAMSCI